MASPTQPSHVGSDGVVRCLHRLEAMQFTCKNGDNKGKRFYKCHKHSDTKDNCSFWKWEHDLFPPQDSGETQNPSPPATPQKRRAQGATTKKASKRARFELVVRAGDSDSSDNEGNQSTEQQMLPTPPSSAPGRKSAAVSSRRRREEDPKEGEEMEDVTSDGDGSPSGAYDLEETFNNAIDVARDAFGVVRDRADRQQNARSKSTAVQGRMLRALREENERLKAELRDCKEQNQRLQQATLRNQETILNLSRALLPE